MKSYSNASSDLERTLERMKSEYHADLDGVTVSALFVFDDDADNDAAVLKHQGYPAAAVVSITPVKQRALGIADAVIVVDRNQWNVLSARQRDALMDHELTHLMRVIDEEDGKPRFDAIDRPKLAIRRHDHQLGWFDEVARRHADASPEMRQAKQLLESTQQLYFDFGATPPATSKSVQKRVAAQKGARGRCNGKHQEQRA